MLNINPEIMAQVVEMAKRRAGGDARWVSAIDRAVQMLDGNPYIAIGDDELLVMSDTSLKTYAANGSCQCDAFKFGRPCKHRALRRLLQRYFEAAESGALWVAKPRASRRDMDGETEFAVMFDGPMPATPAPRYFFNNSGQFETLAAHTAWCEGCAECWRTEAAAA